MAAEIKYLIARGVFATYGYFVIDPASGHGFLIDPGAEPGLFLRAVQEGGWTIEKILLTHGHFDHMGAAAPLREALHAPVYAHEISDRYLLSPKLNLSAQNGMPMILEGAEIFRGGGTPSAWKQTRK